MPPLPDTLSKESDIKTPYQFAYPFAVSIALADVACVERGDSLYYALEILSEGASSLNLIFEDVRLSESSYLCVYGADSCDFQKYTAKETNATNILPTALVGGSVIYIRFVEAKSVELKSTWVITQVAHDYTQFYQKESVLKSSSSCNVDINCDEGNAWQVEKRAVCKLLIQGVTACTGTLVNNTAKDNTPYVLTANHCIASNTKALKTVFYFDYENEQCGITSANSSKTISGSSLVATPSGGKLDFSLLRLNQTPPESYKPYYAGWNLTEQPSEKGFTCIHHPKGDVKKISIDNGMISSVTFQTKSMSYYPEGHWKVSSWEVGTTEGGSSGSPLFDANHLIVGTLSGGEATCDSPTNDFFSKVSKAWDSYDASEQQLKSWLDPLNLGQTKCQGMDPYALAPNVMTNITSVDTLCLYDFDSAALGFWSGANEVGWTAVAERFVTRKVLYDFVISGFISEDENLVDIQFCVWTGTQKPETLVFSVDFNPSMIQDSATIYVKLPEPIEIQGICWVGYKIKNDSHAFAAYLAKSQNDGDLYVKHPKGWVSTDTLGLPAHLGVLLHVTDCPDTLQSYGYEKPFFARSVSSTVVPNYSEALFAVDSIGAIRSNTSYSKVASEYVDNWSGPNSIGVNCMANMITLKNPVWIRDLKIAVAEIPDTSLKTEVCIWSYDFSDCMVRKTISNTDLYENHFNQIPLDTLLYVDTAVAYGICLDSLSYEKNISLLQYYDVESNVDAYFYCNGAWISYQDEGVPYNIGLQPIIGKSKYHYIGTDTILRYPIPNNATRQLEGNVELLLYPTLCTGEFVMSFKKNVFNSVFVEMYNDKGYCVLENDYTMKDGLFQVSVPHLSSGVYVVKITAGEQVFLGKVILLKQ